MKNSILLFLLGIFVTISFAATQISRVVTQIQPITPKSTIVESFHNMYGVEDSVKQFVISKVRQGYIVKTIAISEYQDWQRAVVVMEKY